MNVLVTAADRIAGYGVARGLRGVANKIVATVDPSTPSWGRSRFYDITYRRRAPTDGWLAAPGDREPTQNEMDHVESLIRICERHEIDLIFPAPYDVEHRILSRHKLRFEALGIAVVVPTHTAFLKACDKYAAVVAAKEQGFPVPRSHLCSSIAEAEAAAEDLGFPLVVKGRFSTGSNRVLKVTSHSHLAENVRLAALLGGSALVQEYVPGTVEPSLNYLIDRDGSVREAFALYKPRYLMPSISTAVRVELDHEELEAGGELLASMGLHGFGVIQTKLDTRDGRHRLIEINPRLGSNSRILTGLWPDLIEACIDTELGRPVARRREWRKRLGVAPFDDLLAGVVYARHRGSAPEGSPMRRLGRIFDSYLSDYSRSPGVDCYFRALFDDPMPALAHYASLLRMSRQFPQAFLCWPGEDA